MITPIDEDEPPRVRSNLVKGPRGFTESFDDDTVDLMVRMGLVKWIRTSSSWGWEVNIYHAPGVEE